MRKACVVSRVIVAREVLLGIDPSTVIRADGTKLTNTNFLRSEVIRAHQRTSLTSMNSQLLRKPTPKQPTQTKQQKAESRAQKLRTATIAGNSPMPSRLPTAATQFVAPLDGANATLIPLQHNRADEKTVAIPATVSWPVSLLSPTANRTSHSNNHTPAHGNSHNPNSSSTHLSGIHSSQCSSGTRPANNESTISPSIQNNSNIHKARPPPAPPPEPPPHPPPVSHSSSSTIQHSVHSGDRHPSNIARTGALPSLSLPPPQAPARATASRPIM